MEARARSLVFWLGITADTHHIRAECSPCIRNAPSHAQMPASDQFVPSSPFEAVFGDIFGFNGHHFLIASDRLSGWTEIYKAPHVTPQAGYDSLISALTAPVCHFWCSKEVVK